MQFIFRVSEAKLPQLVRIWLLACTYSAILILSLWIAYLFRYEFVLPPEVVPQLAQHLMWCVPLALALLWWAGQFRSLLSFFSIPDFSRIAYSQAGWSLVELTVWYATQGKHAPPRSVILMSALFTGASIVLFRLGLRLLRERYHLAATSRAARRRVAVIGASDIGAYLAKEMKHRHGLRMQPIAFFDEDPRRWGRQIHGIPILGSYKLLCERSPGLDISEAVLASPTLKAEELGSVVRELTHAGYRCTIAPRMEELMRGKQQWPDLRPVDIEDLLGRESVNLRTDLIRGLISERVIAVTGAGGSIGSELCRQILEFSPRQLVLIEQCEVQLFAIEQELLKRYPGRISLAPYVADVLDQKTIETILIRHSPDVVFHAAAHKHVPLMEHQPVEALQNNVFGTVCVADACLKCGVERFVMISTDKAINPTSVMGVTKRLGELYIQALQAAGRGKTRYMAVRFGNVLGSSGSVIPTFKRQIAEGGPVTVTHPEVTRYFMTTNEAVGLVLQSATQGEGGEIFVLDMGRPVKIVDLARQLVELSGLRPNIDIEIKITGLRPGEKLYEELNHMTENHRPTTHPKIMRFLGPAMDLDKISTQLHQLRRASHESETDEIKRAIQKIVPEYKPYFKTEFSLANGNHSSVAPFPIAN